MTYEILQTHSIYENDILSKFYVLWKDGDRSKATYSTLENRAGYFNLSKDSVFSPKLVQKVAGGGSKMTDSEKNKMFNLK